MRYLKHILPLFLLLFFATALSGQSKRITELERKAESQTGTELIQTRLTLANLYHDKKEYDKALDNAKQAQELAQNADRRDDVRKALLLQGKIMQQIAALKKEQSAPEQRGAPAEATASENTPQRAAPAANDTDRRRMEQTIVGMSKEKASIEKALLDKEKEIAAMTDEQARLALLSSQQRNMLDSLSIRTLRDSIELALSEAKTQEQSALLALERNRRNLLLAIAAVILLIAGGLYTRYKGVTRYNALLTQKNELILAEQQRSEELLLNILPAAIAAELKKTGVAQARKYEQATVLFTDFKGFSKIANGMTADKLVADLDYCYGEFDKIIEKNGLEKIKTIGDSYMCAGGLPESDTDHAVRMVRAALDIQKFLTRWNIERIENGYPALEARIGIHTGPLVAGVVGSKKFAYDIWGDTVNIASRVESAGEAGRVNVSENTFRLIKDRFKCSFRGELPVKNLHPVAMYFVED
jgi:adenylate cyclase